MIHINRDYFGVGTNQNLYTKDPVTGPKDLETKENYIIDDPRTTKNGDTTNLGTTEVHTTADPGTTQNHTTEDLRRTEDYTTKHLDTRPEGRDLVPAVKPTGLLTPIRIILISLGHSLLDFIVVSIWPRNVKNIMGMRASEEDEVDMGSCGMKSSQARNLHRALQRHIKRLSWRERKGASSIKSEDKTEAERKMYETEEGEKNGKERVWREIKQTEEHKNTSIRRHGESYIMV